MKRLVVVLLSACLFFVSCRGKEFTGISNSKLNERFEDVKSRIESQYYVAFDKFTPHGLFSTWEAYFAQEDFPVLFDTRIIRLTCYIENDLVSQYKYEFVKTADQEIIKSKVFEAYDLKPDPKTADFYLYGNATFSIQNKEVSVCDTKKNEKMAKKLLEQWKKEQESKN